LTQALIRVLQPRHLLLILDNCEHLLSACVDISYALLRHCPHLRILATSREVLGMGAERIWRVPPLREPGAFVLPTHKEVAGSEAVALFVDRARAVRPEFTVTERNAATVAEVCRRLDGLPLPIELAAARLKVLTVEQLAERLRSHLRLLTSRDRSAPTRQRTLHATIEWSYQLLGEREQRLFDRLSVFSGGWTLEAAEAIGVGDGSDPDEVLDLLERLIDKSLVLAEPTEDGPPRYRLLETLRQYAQERLLARGESEATRRRHATIYLRMVEESEHAVSCVTGADLACISPNDAEQGNVQAALAWLLDQGEINGAVISDLMPPRCVRIACALRLVHAQGLTQSELEPGEVPEYQCKESVPM
jgi:predicted ATPase